jgi:hypothetical protein
MAREEKISLASAAVIASLPEADQEEFSQTHGKNPVDKSGQKHLTYPEG